MHNASLLSTYYVRTESSHSQALFFFFINQKLNVLPLPMSGSLTKKHGSIYTFYIQRPILLNILLLFYYYFTPLGVFFLYICSHYSLLPVSSYKLHDKTELKDLK